MRVILILLIAMAIPYTHAGMCERKNTNYYRNAELNQFPAMPSEPISNTEADQLESEGSEYYIHVLCESGEPVSLTKRWNKRLYFEIKYLYENNQLIGQKNINANGEINEYYTE